MNAASKNMKLKQIAPNRTQKERNRGLRARRACGGRRTTIRCRGREAPVGARLGHGWGARRDLHGEDFNGDGEDLNGDVDGSSTGTTSTEEQERDVWSGWGERSRQEPGAGRCEE
jgi:hypothetical protein